MKPNTTLRPLLVRAVVQALREIFEDNRYADKVIEYALRQNPKAGSHDRAFIAETIYDIVRYYRLYTHHLGKTPHTEENWWQLVGTHFLLQGISLPPWREFEGLAPLPTSKKTEATPARAIRESIPDWLDELGSAELPDRWDITLHHLNQPAPVVLRTNRLRTDRAALQSILSAEGVDTSVVGADDALVLTRRQNVFRTEAFRKGLFEVQDYSSQLVAPFLDVQPGMRVVDACAGGGGKTLHLAALLQNRGNIIALDTFAWKLDELRTRARRAGATNIETRPIESRKTIKRLHSSADRLLLDVPCSGLGILRRNPDSKWKLNPEQIRQLRTTQQDILQHYSPIVKSGGRMVYATCSILPSENERQIDTFLHSQAGSGFRLLQQRSILPQDEGFDGFFMALLERQ